jgi:hypothetical protein
LDGVTDAYTITEVEISRRMRWVWNVAGLRDKKLLYRVLVGKSERKTPLGILKRRWKDNIKMDLQGVCRVRWIGSFWLRIEIGGGQL